MTTVCAMIIMLARAIFGSGAPSAGDQRGLFFGPVALG